MIPNGPKSTWEDQARSIVAQGYPAVHDLLPDLLEWLSDLNWPGATIIANFLRSVGAPIVPLVRDVLRGSDRMWQYWVIGELCLYWDAELVAQVEPQLIALAQVKDEEGVSDQAKRLLARQWSLQAAKVEDKNTRVSAQWPGRHWRFLARDLRWPGEEVYHLYSDGQSWFDELVVGDWLHIEWMQGRHWWMRVGDARVSVSVPDGHPAIVQIERDNYYTRPSPEEMERIVEDMDPDDDPYGPVE